MAGDLFQQTAQTFLSGLQVIPTPTAPSGSNSIPNQVTTPTPAPPASSLPPPTGGAVLPAQIFSIPTWIWGLVIVAVLVVVLIVKRR